MQEKDAHRRADAEMKLRYSLPVYLREVGGTPYDVIVDAQTGERVSYTDCMGMGNLVVRFDERDELVYHVRDREWRTIDDYPDIEELVGVADYYYQSAKFHEFMRRRYKTGGFLSY